jgi:phosphatidylglycerol---prolipoprotein diacylglyceryl transferase
MTCPFIDPVLFTYGPLELRWYGLLYSLAALVWYGVTLAEFRRKGGPVPPERMPELFVSGLVGAILGARIGYVFIHGISHYVAQPWEIFAFWHGGMSFHGSYVGMIVGGLVFVRRHRYPVGEIADAAFLGIPLGLMLVKIGNFINCESFGRVTSVPWGVVFPAGGPLPRHPVQLYEAFLQGPLLFAILWMLRSKTKKPGEIGIAFMLGYALLRFVSEFFRGPDPNTNFIWHGLTLAQVLCLIMFAVGVGLLVYSRTRADRHAG